MGRIQSNIGIITGVPITETVDALMSISARPRDLIASRTKQLQAEQAAIGELTALVLGVQFAGKNLAKESLFNAKTAASSRPESLAATVTGSPAAGSYQFTPLVQAQSQQLLSGGFASRDTPIGAGSITISRGTEVDRRIELSQLNGGAGVPRGKIRITDRSGAAAEIDLRYAVKIDDVIAKINEADGVQVTAVADGDAIRLVDDTGSSNNNLRVAEVNGGTTAAGLGLAGIDVAADEATGSDVLSLHRGIRASQLRDGSGLSLRQGVADLTVTFRDGSSPLSIDFNDLAASDKRDTATLGDILDRLNAADPTRLSAAISADGDRIVVTDLTSDTGGTFGVASANGGSLAEELGIATSAAAAEITGTRLLAGLKDTLLSSLEGGAGSGALGSLDLEDRSGTTATVDLSNAETLGDVIDAINTAGIGIRAQVNRAGNGLELRDTSGGTGNLTIASGDANNAAEKLKIAAGAAQSSIDSGSLHRQTVSRQTKLSDYNGGAGVKPGHFVITDSQGASAVITLTGTNATHIGDVLDLINAAGIGVTASINATGDGIQLTDTAGGSGTLSVGTSNRQTASDLRIAGAAQIVDVGGTPTQVIDGSTATTIEISAEDTLDDLVEKLNAAGLQLSASIFSDGSPTAPFRLSITSTVSGEAGRHVFDTSAAGFTVDEIVAAEDARLLFGSVAAGGIVATSSTGTFNDLVSGLSLDVKTSSTDPVTITVAGTDASFVTGVKVLVEQYNKLHAKIQTQTSFDPETNTTGILFGSGETLRIESEFSRLFTGRQAGLSGAQSLAELGLSVNDDGSLALDEAKLKAQFAADPEGVKDFFLHESRGFAGKLDRLAESFVNVDNSLLLNRYTALTRKVEFNEERIERMTASLDRQREALLAQFYNMESVIAKLQESLTSIQSIAALPPLYTTK
jgi:flagellar hook-associated protein 2